MPPTTTNMTAESSALQVKNDHELRVACFCEENVWRLAYRKCHGGNNSSNNDDYFVIFISNEKACVPMFHQIAATARKNRNEEEDNDELTDSSSMAIPIFWDYHVILMARQKQPSKSSTTLIYDIDSDLSYPCPIEEYLGESFAGIENYKDEYKPMFRVVQASVFLKNFKSDRMHMYDEETGWSATPPTYKCIQPTNGSNLMQYMNMLNNNHDREDGPLGKVYSISELLAKYR
jgi:protein N-terminal glutamine amidohydrolase